MEKQIQKILQDLDAIFVEKLGKRLSARVRFLMKSPTYEHIWEALIVRLHAGELDTTAIIEEISHCCNINIEDVLEYV